MVFKQIYLDILDIYGSSMLILKFLFVREFERITRFDVTLSMRHLPSRGQSYKTSLSVIYELIR
jgi:hypothetical protein